MKISICPYERKDGRRKEPYICDLMNEYDSNKFATRACSHFSYKNCGLRREKIIEEKKEILKLIGEL
jgi:hypothetical protein